MKLGLEWKMNQKQCFSDFLCLKSLGYPSTPEQTRYGTSQVPLPRELAAAAEGGDDGRGRAHGHAEGAADELPGRGDHVLHARGGDSLAHARRH